MRNGLPQGWVEVKLPTVAQINMGQSPPSNTYNTKGKGLPFYQGKSEFRDLFPTPSKYCSDPLKIAEPEDILISVRAPVGPTNLCREKSCIGRGLASIRPLGELSNRYLLYYLRSIENWLSAQGTGSTFTAISKSDLEELTIPIAPLDEHRRIVKKLEKLLDKVGSCQKRLSNIPIILKRFRQSVLAAACSGRLTADWRENNKSKSAVEETIAAIREKREAVVKTPSQKERLRQIYESSEGNDSNSLPETWRFIALNKICDSFDYGTSAKSHPTGKIPVLRMGNIQNGKIDWTDLVFTSDENEIQDYLLKPNTVLFNRTNSPELVGKTAIYRGERPAIFAGYLIRMNPSPELDPEYINLCLNTNYAREFCRGIRTDGVSQSNINAQKLGTFEVPFCSLNEQKEIVCRVKSLFAIADRIEERYSKARKQVNILTQSLLAKAFRGELVPQDPNDEPADKLFKILDKHIENRRAKSSL
jgi:type I restriction enzyme S subunit